MFTTDTDEGVAPPDVLQFAPENTFFHTDFKISSSGETIYLRNNSGGLVDSLSFENLQSDVSIGVSSNSTDLVYFQTTTPNDENEGLESAGIVSSVVQFSDDGGSVNNTINFYDGFSN